MYGSLLSVRVSTQITFQDTIKSFLFKSKIADTFPIYMQRYVLKSNILHLDDKMGKLLFNPFWLV